MLKWFLKNKATESLQTKHAMAETHHTFSLSPRHWPLHWPLPSASPPWRECHESGLLQLNRHRFPATCARCAPPRTWWTKPTCSNLTNLTSLTAPPLIYWEFFWQNEVRVFDSFMSCELFHDVGCIGHPEDLTRFVVSGEPVEQDL